MVLLSSGILREKETSKLGIRVVKREDWRCFVLDIVRRRRML